MAKISIIFVTNRKNCLEILKDNLDRQIFRDYEVIIADDLLGYTGRHIPIENAIHFKPRQKEKGDVWNLNKAYNDALGHASGELLVFLQDFIWIPADGLQRFWNSYEQFPDALVTGVGHKAQDALKGISEVDNRVFGNEEFSAVNWSFWELNWSSCPAKYMVKFEEKMDKFYGGENHYIAYKASAKGHPIVIDRRNRCIGYSQDFCGGRPKNWEEMHYNKHPSAQKIVVE